MASLYIFGAFLFVLAGESMALHETSNGAGGDFCGPRTCLSDVGYCDGDKCKCINPYVYGDATLNCYKKSEFRTEVTNDPHIKTYNNISIDLPVPCRYLLTHVVTEYKDRKRQVVGSCEFMVHAFHKKRYGKFYVGGYDVAIRVECNNGSRYEWTFRKYGEAEDGKYNYYINATDGEFLPDGPNDNDDIDFYDPKTNLKIKCKIDKINNLAIIEAKKCGARIRFRPYDVVKKIDQKQVPGLAVTFGCPFHPEFESLDRVLACPTTWAHNGFTIDSIIIPGLGRMGTMMYRAYMSGIPQTQPDPNPACPRAKESLEKCLNLFQLNAAYHNCIWILTSPRFIRCYDKTSSGVDIQDLFNQCVDIYCAGTKTCGDIVTQITNKKCENVPGYTAMTTFITSCP